jgi:hypothetical protein
MLQIMCKIFGRNRLNFALFREEVCIKDEKGSKEWSTLKDLSFVWEKTDGYWNECNTLIVDDTFSKIRMHPSNAINIGTCKGMTHKKMKVDNEMIKLKKYLSNLQENFETVDFDVRNYVIDFPFN